MNASTWGVLLAGGRGTRLGGVVKAALDLGEGPLGSVLCARLQAVSAEVVIVGDTPGYEPPPGVRQLGDLRPGRGPLGGLETALTSSPHDRVLVLACDLPFVPVSLLERLRAAPSAADVVLAVAAGRKQPLCARYHRRCLPAVSAGLDDGRNSMHGLLPQLSVTEVETDEGSLFNLNTPDDIDRARAMR